MPTKHYDYWLYYDSGCETPDDDSINALQLMLWRAKKFRNYRIRVVAHDDTSDLREAGMAAFRLNVLTRHFIAESIAAHHLEARIHDEHCCREVPSWLKDHFESGVTDAKSLADLAGYYRRAANVRMFPRVASLSPGFGSPYLDYEEIDTLQIARELILFVDKVDLVQVA
jgi:hypothetical protein